MSRSRRISLGILCFLALSQLQVQAQPSLPIVFVPGFCATHATWTPAANQLTSLDPARYGSGPPRVLASDGVNVGVADGLPVETIGKGTKLFVVAFWAGSFDPTAVANISIEEKAGQLQKILERIRALTDHRMFTLVGHSQGGLVARAYVQQRGFQPYAGDVGGVVTVDTPHQGLVLASLGWLTGPIGLATRLGSPLVNAILSGMFQFDCLSSPSINLEQLQPGSLFLVSLNAQQAPPLPLVSISSWSGSRDPGDHVVNYDSQSVSNLYANSIYPLVTNFDNPIPGLEHLGPLLHTGIHSHPLTVNLLDFAATNIARRYVPNRIDGVSSVVNNDVVTVRWNAPESLLPVRQYRFQASTIRDTTQLSLALPATATEHTFRGVPPGTYFVRVYAESDAGAGPASADASVVVPVATLPTAPSLAIRVLGNEISAQWTAGSGPTPTSFILEVGRTHGASDALVLPLEAGSIAGNVPDGHYFIRVKGKNSAGVGPPSNEAVAIVPAAAQPPRITNVLPDPVRRSDGEQVVTLVGTGFQAVPTIRIEGYQGADLVIPPSAIVSVTPAEIKFRVDLRGLRLFSQGLLVLRLTNPDGTAAFAWLWRAS